VNGPLLEHNARDEIITLGLKKSRFKLSFVLNVCYRRCLWFDELSVLLHTHTHTAHTCWCAVTLHVGHLG